jgi:hypothetical protein
MPEWLINVLFMTVGILQGAISHSAWMESRHDCLPHSPDKCRFNPDH